MSRILVIDDSASIRSQVRAALCSAGFEVVEAVDGLDGLKKMGEDAGFSAVICDVNMPRMDGLSMLEQMHASGSCSGIPIVMLTTEGHPELIRRAKDAGAKGWIVKPFKPELLVMALRKLTS
jgi:two-component system chemotaxis response regulator CheY